ncbi:MAG: hypothetical protein ABJA35_08580 [Parafilimonas sp.]
MNTINRNNYEEFFLLYVDDELDEASKTAVENFVQQNPDLTTEFAMLMQTKFVAHESIFFDKENLLRTEGNSINESNHVEYFLLYIDNELSAAKREEVEMYVLQHPKLQDEFTTLKQAVLAPEIISYGNKKDLYRTEKRRTFYLKPLQLAVAAIFIGICAVGFWLMQKPATVITVADKHITQQPKQNAVISKPVDSIKQQINQPEQIVAQQQSSPIKKEKKPTTETAVIKKKTENTTKDIFDNNNNAETQVAIQQHPLIKHNDIEKNQKEPPTETKDIADAPQHLQQQQNDVASLQTSAQEKNDNNYNVYPVAYKEINTNDDDNSLHVGMLDLNKSKVKNLFKKAGRFFGNKTNDLANEDGKLQVANFEIETKKQ